MPGCPLRNHTSAWRSLDRPRRPVFSACGIQGSTFSARDPGNKQDEVVSARRITPPEGRQPPTAPRRAHPPPSETQPSGRAQRLIC